jgi:hypothetical protein
VTTTRRPIGRMQAMEDLAAGRCAPAFPELAPKTERVLPQALAHILTMAFPPGNTRAGGFQSKLVDLMTKADADNLVRLMAAFPGEGLAFLLWDAGLVEFPKYGEPGLAKEAKAMTPQIRGILTDNQMTPGERVVALRLALDSDRTRGSEEWMATATYGNESPLRTRQIRPVLLTG